MPNRVQFEQRAATGYDNAVGNMTRLLVPTLLEATGLAPGERVLDVASGTGIAAEVAAGIIGPSGHITASDVAPAMIELARARLGARSNIEFAVDDAQAMRFPDASFDRVICNMGVMYFPDPLRGLAEMRRVLRAGGRVAVSVNTAPETALVSRILPIMDRLSPPVTARSGPNSFDGSEQHMRRLLTAAGFQDVATSTNRWRLPFASFDAYFGGIEQGAGNVGQEYLALPETAQKVVREETRALVGDTGGAIEIEITITFASGKR